MKILNSGIFPFYVYVSTNLKDFKLPKEELERFDSDYDGLTLRVLNGNVYIHLRSKEKHIIVHELFHATEFILEYVGIPHSKKTSECYAHLLEHLTKQFYDK